MVSCVKSAASLGCSLRLSGLFHVSKTEPSARNSMTSQREERPLLGSWMELSSRNKPTMPRCEAIDLACDVER
jgi:hypothetical protein